jgi:hypothetical protein
MAGPVGSQQLAVGSIEDCLLHTAFRCLVFYRAKLIALSAISLALA